MPRRCRAAFEFRHESWLADDTYEALRAADAALCIADTEELVDAARRHGELGISAIAPRGLRRIRYSRMGKTDIGADRGKTRSSTSSTRTKPKAPHMPPY